MKKTIGILAHVDAGKTTFSEQLLFHTNSIQKRGRVDHRDSHLDVHLIEQQRGITVYADEATFHYGENDYTLIDTPGHIDFSAEMERALLALDGAILVIDGSDGVQGHIDTIWSLLQKHQIPTMIFVNKMDHPNASEAEVEQDIQEKLTPQAISLPNWAESIEDFAMLDDETMDIYLEERYQLADWQQAMMKAFMTRRFFPIVYGSALKDEGIDWFIEVVDKLLQPEVEQGDLQAVIYKIRHIEQNQRVAFVKVKSGQLQVRQSITLLDETHKITQLRKYNGVKFEELQQAEAGDTVAIVGLKNAQAGMVLGASEQHMPILTPTLRAKVISHTDIHPKEMLAFFRLLEAEDPALGIEWQEEAQEITLKIMGKIQLEVIRQVFEERFSHEISFAHPTIIYKETIGSKVNGYGHFEPLKHYAEVHLRMEPAERGTGIHYESICHANDLTLGNQRAVGQIVQEGGHHGLLTGSEVTDVKITLLTGRAHQKHTEGGDFREATLRALRQGLEQVENILLEPYNRFVLKADIELLGRMMNDLTLMHAQVADPEISGDFAILKGQAPVALLMDYPSQFAAYTNGKGSIQLRFAGYDLCHNTEEVVEQLAYRKDADPEYSSNSVFCAKGKGYTVPWQEAKQAMHCPTDK
ncbi:MAG: TetM/TetW/TetO/TetS family tetracycline resistance ribosomal protection protein [Kurthia sp.]|nr:TetM/TetW/TetO/TetS family tetracycline resistance ribosomal protection protein [Candidatus Kurthia equi]